MWREHLDTKSEAEARPRCLEVAAKVERLLQQAQDRHDADQGIGAAEPPTLTIEGLARIVANWKASERSRRAQFTLERPVMPGWSDFLREAALNGICNQKPNSEGPEAYLERLDARQTQIDAIVRKLTQAHGLFIDQQHPAHAILSDLVGQAWIDVLDDVAAKQFDALNLRTQLSVLRVDPAFVGLRTKAVELAGLLEEYSNVPMVAREMALIQEVQGDDFWQDVTAPILETIKAA